MAFDNIVLEKKEKVAWITLNKPEAMNVLSTAALLELDKALADVEADDNIVAVVVTGAGERAFCAGADLKEIGKLEMLDKSSGFLPSEYFTINSGNYIH